ncbi:hypothetical protein EON65_22905 [archaeon]|nr:MAG: hypothetical protein EON65_22905 [archaeon]
MGKIAQARPKKVVSDNKLEFVAGGFDELLRQGHIKHLITRSHSQNDNGLIESKIKKSKSASFIRCQLSFS